MGLERGDGAAGRQPAVAAARDVPRPAAGRHRRQRVARDGRRRRCGRRPRRPRGAGRPAVPGISGLRARRRRRRGARTPAAAPPPCATSRRCASCRPSWSGRATSSATTGAGSDPDPEGTAPARRDRAAADLLAAGRAIAPGGTRIRGPAVPTNLPAPTCRGSSATSGPSTRSGPCRTPYSARRVGPDEKGTQPAPYTSTPRTSPSPRRPAAPARRWHCCVDLSFSMVQEDRWGPMKQTALALAHLISSRFRQDALQIIGFDRAGAAAHDGRSWPRSSRSGSRAPTCTTR